MEKNFWQLTMLNKNKPEIVQINLGNKCNQACRHCHIDASPSGDKNMDSNTADLIIKKLLSMDIKEVEFTGGTPEMNPNFIKFIETLGNKKKLTVRSSLTILKDAKYQKFINIYKKYKIKIVASLPGIFDDEVDQQRGAGTYRDSIEVLRKLSKIGYGKNNLQLDLVYNPVGDYLPPALDELERDFKVGLEKYSINFNNIIPLVNMPIKRYRDYLIKNKKLEEYNSLLKSHYNPAVLGNIMCRRLVSVDYQGFIYDCDFNLATEKRIKGYENKHFWEIDFRNWAPEITFSDYCYGCTVNQGSSCQGVLTKTPKLDIDIVSVVRDYYGKEIQKTSDLKTAACCTTEAPPDYIKESLPFISDEIKMKYYGCGSAIPYAIEGITTLDIGCGTGRDCYIMSRLVGEKGFVYGIDMTKEQIEIARRHIKSQAQRFGYKKPNTEFIFDYVENLDKHIKKESIDLVISNCVINLIKDKANILKKIFAVLKYGGEFYFSDVYSDRRVPEDISKNPMLYGECMGGALYINDFERIAREAGFKQPRIMKKRLIETTNPEIAKLIGNIKFYSITYRLWKIKNLEEKCEDYGHIAIYNGGIPYSEFKVPLDRKHIFEINKPERVCGNTALMLSETRFKPYFRVIGNFNTHFGEFVDCATPLSESNSENMTGDGCGCC